MQLRCHPAISVPGVMDLADVVPVSNDGVLNVARANMDVEFSHDEGLNIASVNADPSLERRSDMECAQDDGSPPNASNVIVSECVNNSHVAGASNVANSSSLTNSLADLVDSTRRYQVNGDSYASRAARTDGGFAERNLSQETPRRQPGDNDMPKRPKSAFFTPSRFTSARSVFTALKDAEISSNEIQCLQRKMNGEVIITFSTAAAKERFLGLNSLRIDREAYAIQDIDRPLTFLTVYDAPFELSDLAIIKRLSPFCEVINYRRGKFDFMPDVYNGLRHYRVRLIKPIPSFLRFGRYQILLKHDGQRPTCRRCNCLGHYSNACDIKICFNCENIGHEANRCPAPKLCSICKEDGHLGVNCRYSWLTPTVRGARTDETAPVDIVLSENDNDNDSVASFKTRSEDSFAWADESDLSDDPEFNEPLISAVLSASDRAIATSLPVDIAASPAGSSPPGTLPSCDLSTAIPLTGAAPLIQLISPPVAAQFSQPSVTPSADSAMSAEPAAPDPASGASLSEHILDAQGFVKPADPQIQTPPSNDPTVVPVYKSPTPSPRINRRTPAPFPDALAAAGRRKPTSPTLVTTKPRDSSSSSPMDPTGSDLKRKLTDERSKPKRDREKKKKGSKHK